MLHNSENYFFLMPHDFSYIRVVNVLLLGFVVVNLSSKGSEVSGKSAKQASPLFEVSQTLL